MNTIFPLLILSFLFSSCAMTKKNQAQLHYGQDVEKYLSTIEEQEHYQEEREREEDPLLKRRREAINRYRIIREEKIKNRNRNRVRNRQHTYRPHRIVYKKKVKPIRKKRIIHADPEQLSTEIEQKMKYYCMKNRKSQSFQEQGSCQAFTQVKFDSCSVKYDRDDKNLLYCIEKSIR